MPDLHRKQSLVTCPASVLAALSVCLCVLPTAAAAQQKSSTSESKAQANAVSSSEKSRTQAEKSADESAEKPVGKRTDTATKRTARTARSGSKLSAGETAREGHSNADEQAALALAFAKKHHPELYDLLARLRKANRPQFRKAINQLQQTRVRLERMAERTPDRYELSLRQWQVDSRIRLLVARMTMSRDTSLETELQSLLAERVRLKLALLKNEQQRLASRLKRLDGQISEIEGDPTLATQKELAIIQRSLGITPTKTRTRPEKSRNRSAANSNGSKTASKNNKNKTSGRVGKEVVPNDRNAKP